MDKLLASEPVQLRPSADKRGRAVTIVLQHLIDAISLGSLYALAALGIGLIFGVLRLVNFAHGDFITVGCYALILPSLNPIAIMVVGDLPAHFLVPAIISTVVILALLTEIIVFRPLRTADPSTMMIGAFALSYLIQHVILAVYSSRPKAVNLWPDLNVPIEVVGLRIPKLEIVTVTTTLALMIMFGLFLRYTPHGIQMRAASEDFRMARMLGIRANVVIGIAFGMSGALAGIVSLLLVTQTGVLGYQMGLPLLLVAFVSTVIGGMGSLVGATLGGFVVGVGSVLLQALLPIELRPYRDVFVFLFVILILLFRPQGLIRVKAFEERI